MDPDRNLLYVSTGYNYTVPQTVADCLLGGGVSELPDPDDIDSILALDLQNGRVRTFRGDSQDT